MLKTQYLPMPEVAAFVTFLQGVINGTREINFRPKADPSPGWQKLGNAKAAYLWPRAAKHCPGNNGTPDFPPEACFSLPGKSNLETNDAILRRLSLGLQAAFNSDEDLTPWVAAILIWGGVYTETAGGDGNKGWLRTHTHDIRNILTITSAALQNGSDDMSAIRNLRFNAGMTKVYSLLLKDFVIYDSRVAAALAWLVLRWKTGDEAGLQLTQELKFQCLKAKEYTSKKNPKPPKIRNPDPLLFSNLGANAYAHATWNLRANWVLTAAFPKGGNADFRNLRDVEAALFMMGADLTHALP